LTKRTRNLYDPESSKPFKLSRSKIDSFMNCQRCFYLDRKLGVSQPPGFPFNINSAVDELLKKEFDYYRSIKEPHPYMKNLDINVLPYQNKDLDDWRQNFKGVQYFDEKNNFIITGAVDDIWIDVDTNELIVVDYKSTSKNTDVTIDEDWQVGYRRQMDIYQWLLRKNGYSVSSTGFFVYCNGDKSKERFNNTITFKVSILKYEANSEWIENSISKIKLLLDQDMIPEYTESCSYCTYLMDVYSVSN
jgi:CRISPR/Cas system-associated exonuclease Cas4 (RecB family)